MLARRGAEVVCFAGLGVFASLLLLETHAHAMPVLGMGASATTAAAWQPLPVGFSPAPRRGREQQASQEEDVITIKVNLM